MKKLTEKQIQAKILSCLRQDKIYAVKVVLANRNGVPDILACINGQFVAFEVKAEKGKTSSLQEYNIKQIKNSMGLAFVVHSVDEFLDIYNSLIL
jgi:Holliday junction resolvase